MKPTLTLLFLFLLLVLAPAAFAADQKEPFLIGSIQSLSSWGAPAGKGELNAITMAVDDINSAGGVAGRPVKLISEDTRSEFNGVVSAFNKLALADQVPVVLGPNWSEFAEVMAPLAQKASIVMITPSGYSKTLTAGKDYVFSLLPGYSVCTAPLAQYIAGQSYKKIAFIVSENAYFIGLAEALEAHLKKAAVPIAVKESVRPNSQDHRSIIMRFKKLGVDSVVMLLLEDGENAAFMRQAMALDFKPQVLASNAVSYDPVLKQNPELGEGIIYFDFLTRAGEEFKARYRERFGEEPYMASPQAYDSAWLIKEAAEKCGPAPSQIKTCLAKSDYAGVSGRIRFDALRNIEGVEKATSLYRMKKDGRQELP